MKGRPVGRRRPQSDARFEERRPPRLGQELTDSVQQIAHACRRRPLVEADVLDGCADEHRTVLPRHHVAVRPPDDVVERRAAPLQPQQLTAYRAHADAAPSSTSSCPAQLPAAITTVPGRPRRAVVGADRRVVGVDAD